MLTLLIQLNSLKLKLINKQLRKTSVKTTNTNLILVLYYHHVPIHIKHENKKHQKYNDIQLTNYYTYLTI